MGRYLFVGAACLVVICQSSASDVPSEPEEVIAPGRPLATALVVSSEQPRRLNDIGRGKAVIFSPDLAVAGNREFYERLGFIYIETASWKDALRDLHRESRRRSATIDMVIVETHGTNGNGLKLQKGKRSFDLRSYISVGALQEALERSGIRTGVVTACNSGRLFRPEIYNVLLATPGESLFLPPTLGMLQASADFDAALSAVTILRPLRSSLESLIEGEISELRPSVASLFSTRSPEDKFVMSTLLIEILLNDHRLQLTGSGHEEDLSRDDLPVEEREKIFGRFLDHVEAVGARELSHGSPVAHTAGQRP